MPMFASGEQACIFAKPPLLYLSLKAVGQPAVTAVYTILSVKDGDWWRKRAERKGEESRGREGGGVERNGRGEREGGRWS